MSQGIFIQKNGLYAVDVAAACGVMTPEQLAGLAKVAAENHAFRIKLTTRQTLVILLPEESAASLVKSLNSLSLCVAPYGNVVRAVKACAGNMSLCPRSLDDALDLGMEIQKRYLGRETPKDFKIAVAGCARGCTDPYCADFGVIAAGRGVFNIVAGGLGGSSRPRHGEVIAKKISKEKVFSILDHVLARFSALAEPREKLGRTMQRLGLSAFLPPAKLLATEKQDPAADESFLNFLQEKG